MLYECLGRTFLLDHSYPGQSSEVKQQIVEMTLNARGICDIARVDTERKLLYNASPHPYRLRFLIRASLPQ